MKKHLLIFLIAISCNFLYSEISNFSEIYFRSITTKTYGLYPPESYNFNSGIIYKNNLIYKAKNIQKKKTHLPKLKI